ncbi:MAG: alpha/beta fold hydrolase [Gammaproteobacteria bacterium]
MIALHAGIGSVQEWRPLAERLRFAYRVLAPDLYGYATSRETPRCRALRSDATLLIRRNTRTGIARPVLGAASPRRASPNSSHASFCL